MPKITLPLLTVMLLITTSLNGQTVVVDRPTGLPIASSNGVLAGESNRFNEFSGFYPTDHFVLEQATTLQTLIAVGSISSNSFQESSVEGWTVQIFNDDGGQPAGNAFADVFTGGNFGSDGVVYLPAVAQGAGQVYLQNDDGETTVEIDFTVANGGTEIMLPAGAYWMSIAPRTPFWHPGDPTGAWRWQVSFAPSQFTRRRMSRTTFGDVEVWTPINTIGTSFAWQLTGDPATLIGDVNGDGSVNLLDVAPFVELISSGEFQAEADINMDGIVNLLDVTPFVELLSN